MVERAAGGLVRNLVEIGLFLAIVIADAAGLVPITQTIFLLPLIWLMMRLRRESRTSIGLGWPPRTGRALLIGVLAGIGLELMAVFVTTPTITAVTGVAPDHSDLRSVEGNLKLLGFFLAFSWVIAAFGEEVCFRGFLMKRLAQCFGESRTAWVLSLILSSVLFGWGHTEQGVTGWIQEGLSGFWLGVLFLATGRNLLVPIAAHGVSNTIAFVLIYLGRYPGLA